MKTNPLENSDLESKLKSYATKVGIDDLGIADPYDFEDNPLRYKPKELFENYLLTEEETRDILQKSGFLSEKGALDLTYGFAIFVARRND